MTDLSAIGIIRGGKRPNDISVLNGDASRASQHVQFFMHQRTLTGWKEIANYLRVGVRTAQRWEHYGLPVRRIPGRVQGAVFALCHEVSQWMESSALKADHSTQNGHFSHRILFVDDEESIRETGKAIFEKQGYEVHVAEDGFDALNHLNHSLPDVLISDLRMPNMSGFELLSVVRKRFPQIAVVALSGEFLPPESPELILADAFIPKGEDRSKLFAKIIDLLDRSPLRPGIRHAESAAVWLARSKTDYIVITCPYCLRTSPTPQPTDDTVQRVECPHCLRTVAFRMIPSSASGHSNKG